jgi:hypothetical protein
LQPWAVALQNQRQELHRCESIVRRDGILGAISWYPWWEAVAGGPSLQSDVGRGGLGVRAGVSSIGRKMRLQWVREVGAGVVVGDGIGGEISTQRSGHRGQHDLGRWAMCSPHMK